VAVAVASAGPYASLHLQTDNHANTPPVSFLQAGCPSCLPTNSVKALEGSNYHRHRTDTQRPIATAADHVTIDHFQKLHSQDGGLPELSFLPNQIAFSVSTLLVGQQEGCPACKN